MKTLGYYNGKFDELENMSIPMNDRVCYFGDGVYDATCSRNYNIFALDEHIDRIYNSAALLKIEVGQTKEEMKAILNEMVRKWIRERTSFIGSLPVVVQESEITFSPQMAQRQISG